MIWKPYKCFHYLNLNFPEINFEFNFFIFTICSHVLLFKVNLAPQVTKMLSNCDDIIKQHKAACLRVTSLLACKELVWVGTSAGVLLTISAVQMGSGMLESPIVTGLPHGHTGHVRFLTTVDYEVPENAAKVNSKWSVQS